MINGMPWVDFAYNLVALYGVALLIYVMQKTEHDRINKIDPPLLQWVRRMGFVVSALALCYTVMDHDWQRSVPVLLLIGAGDINLTINALALYKRNRPSSGSRARYPAGIAVKKHEPHR